MKHRYLPVALVISMGLLSSPALAQLQGHAYQDANLNGRRDLPTEKGIARIRVRAFDRLGQLLATVTTDTAGAYVLPVITRQPIRLQFDQLPQGLKPAPNQFLYRYIASSGLSHNETLGLYQPADFTGESPQVAISIQPLGAHTDARIDSLDISTVRFLQPDLTSKSKEKTRVSPAVTGSIWGLAYDRGRHRLFSAALAKRHSGFGSLGSGGIYQTHLATNRTTAFISLDALGAHTGPSSLARDLSSSYEGRMNDSLMFGWVGKMGLGGIDLSTNERILYTVSLFDNKLYALQLPPDDQPPTSADLSGYELPKSACPGGTFRPFAVKCHAEKVYVGGVCDAQQSGRTTDLRAYVYAFDPATKRMDQVLDIPLNYQRGVIEYGVGNWFPWTDDPKQVMLQEPAWWAIHPQPILSDLEFDSDGSLLIGLMDRLGHQMATGKGSPDGRWQQTISMAAGDVLRAVPKRKTFILEANAMAGERQSAGENNDQGPQGGEFYFDDTFTIEGTRYHQENGMGGLALLPDSGHLLVSSREPVAEYNSAGISTYDNRTGQKVRGLLAYHHNPTVEVVGRKTNHVGDIEVITALPPTQIGHRVWQDCDEDGQQDADEAGLAGVLIELWQQSQKLAVTHSDSLGHYSFDSRTLTAGLEAGKAYEIRVPLQQPRYGEFKLAFVDATNPVVIEKGYALIRFLAPSAGDNQFDHDFGFGCIEKPQTTAKLACSGNELNAQVSLILTNYGADERYDLSLAQTYTGRAEYATAELIPTGGQLFTQPLAALTENDISVRVFKASGCYQDVFVNVTQSAECVRLLTESGEASTGLQVSPNPTHDKIRVQYSAKTADPVTIQLFSANSRQLHQESITPGYDGQVQVNLDLSRHAPGVYILSIQQGAVVISKKVIRY